MPRIVKKRKLTMAPDPTEAHASSLHSFQCDPGDQLSLLGALRELYLQDQFTDVTFVVGGQEFRGHRVVLAAASGFLSALLKSNMSESTLPRINLTVGFEPELFRFILDYIYGLPIVVPSSEICPLLGLSSSFSMVGLRTQLAQILGCRVTLDNCCSIFAAADAYSCEELKRTALEKLYSNFASVSKTSAFCELSPDLLEHVLGSDDILDCDESLVFEAAVRWLEYMPSDESVSRESVGLRVLSVVRFPLMDSCLLSDVIKGHKLMQGPERAGLLLEAFEHHALKAAGRAGIVGRRTTPRRQSCVFLKSTLLNGHSDAVSALLNMGEWLVSGSWDNNIKVWSTDNWSCVRTLSDHSGAIRSLCVCDEKLVSCSDDGVIKVWTPGSWSCVRSIDTTHDGAVNALLQCKGRLASAGDDGAIKLWNTSNWTCEVTVHHSAVRDDESADEDGSDHDSSDDDESAQVGVLSLEMSRERLVSGGDDCVVRVWNTADWYILLSVHVIIAMAYV
jgi:hypothetical protein